MKLELATPKDQNLPVESVPNFLNLNNDFLLGLLSKLANDFNIAAKDSSEGQCSENPVEISEPAEGRKSLLATHHSFKEMEIIKQLISASLKKDK